MFPLGTVLFPYGVLPLHVFEPRYRALVADCLAAPDGPEFGVVLIERGSEVGGGDTRFDVGTVARIVDASAFDDGRYALATVGTRRLRVLRWLPDDPYPQAVIEELEEPAGDATDATDAIVLVEQRLRRVLGLASELGAAVRTDVTPATRTRCAPASRRARSRRSDPSTPSSSFRSTILGSDSTSSPCISTTSPSSWSSASPAAERLLAVS